MAIDRSTPPLGSLYRELILDHHKRPRNKGPLPDANVHIHMLNPVCGDEVHLHLRLEDDRVADIRFEGQGCSISQASISMMTGLVKGKSRTEIDELASRFTEMMHGDAAAASDRSLRDLRVLQGVSKFAARVKCALLGWNALEEALVKGPADAAGDAARDAATDAPTDGAGD
jgi:nitrogen fixation protein NifU and related proteins